jgi:hypothetical protein
VVYSTRAALEISLSHIISLSQIAIIDNMRIALHGAEQIPLAAPCARKNSLRARKNSLRGAQ